MKLKDYFLNPIFSIVFRYSFAFLLGLSVFLAMFFTSDRSLLASCNACFIPGVVLVGIGFFSILNLLGFFDLAEYGTVSIVQSFKRDSVREYKDLVDYKEKKTIKRKKRRLVFLPYMIFGLIWIVASIIIRSFIKY